MIKNENSSSSSDKTPSFEMTWGSSTSSGYCSQDESDPEFEQYFTARTSFFPKTRKAPASANVKKVSDRRFQKANIKLKQNSCLDVNAFKNRKSVTDRCDRLRLLCFFSFQTVIIRPDFRLLMCTLPFI